MFNYRSINSFSFHLLLFLSTLLHFLTKCQVSLAVPQDSSGSDLSALTNWEWCRNLLSLIVTLNAASAGVQISAYRGYNHSLCSYRPVWVASQKPLRVLKTHFRCIYATEEKVHGITRMTQLQKCGFLLEVDWKIMTGKINRRRVEASVFGSDCSREGWLCKKMKAEAQQSVQMFNVCLCIKQ